MSEYTALVQKIPAPTKSNVEKRMSARFACNLEALSRPLDAPETICWGAAVHDISSGGIGLKLCYPFKPGTYLAIDLCTTHGNNRMLLGRVAHVHDQCSDGTWLVGCEFITQLTDSDVALLI
jgi:hypothetical protein